MNPLMRAINNGTVNLTDAANFAPIGSRINAQYRPLTIHGRNGAADLVDIRVSGTSVRDGVMVPIANGAGLNASVAQIRAMRPAYPACLAANADWEIDLDPHAADVLVEAKGNATSLTITGMVL
jgi:hypothetical protein